MKVSQLEATNVLFVQINECNMRDGVLLVAIRHYIATYYIWIRISHSQGPQPVYELAVSNYNIMSASGNVSDQEDYSAHTYCMLV